MSEKHREEFETLVFINKTQAGRSKMKYDVPCQCLELFEADDYIGNFQ